jgi:hypothetical protein
MTTRLLFGPQLSQERGGAWAIERGHGDFVPERIHAASVRFSPRVQLRSVIEEALNDRIEAAMAASCMGVTPSWFFAFTSRPREKQSSVAAKYFDSG